MQHVEKKFMEVDYNMLVQNQCLSQYVLQKIIPYGVVVQWLRTWIPQCGGEEFKSPHLQPRLPWLLK